MGSQEDSIDGVSQRPEGSNRHATGEKGPGRVFLAGGTAQVKAWDRQLPSLAPRPP